MGSQARDLLRRDAEGHWIGICCEIETSTASSLDWERLSIELLRWPVTDKLSDGRRPISTERAGASGFNPIKAAGDERGGSPGDREPWKAQAWSPAVPSNKSVDHERGTRD